MISTPTATRRVNGVDFKTKHEAKGGKQSTKNVNQRKNENTLQNNKNSSLNYLEIQKTSPRNITSSEFNEDVSPPFPRKKKPINQKTIPIFGSKTYCIRQTNMKNMNNIPSMLGEGDDLFYVFIPGTEPEIIFAEKNNFKSFKGMPHLPGLKELFLQDNLISNFDQMPQLDGLKHLYLNNNNISSFKGAPDLRSLTELELNGNPIVEYVPPDAHPYSELAYRVMAYIAFNCPYLTKVDGVLLSEFERDDGNRIGDLIRDYLRKGYLLRRIINEPQTSRERNKGYYEIKTIEPFNENEEENEDENEPNSENNKIRKIKYSEDDEERAKRLEEKKKNLEKASKQRELEKQRKKEQRKQKKTAMSFLNNFDTITATSKEIKEKNYYSRSNDNETDMDDDFHNETPPPMDESPTKDCLETNNLASEERNKINSPPKEDEKSKERNISKSKSPSPNRDEGSKKYGKKTKKNNGVGSSLN